MFVYSLDTNFPGFLIYLPFVYASDDKTLGIGIPDPNGKILTDEGQLSHLSTHSLFARDSNLTGQFEYHE